MRHQSFYELCPLTIITRRRHIGLVAEDRLVAGGEHARHEREFNKGPHADRAQKVKDTVSVKKGIKRLLLLISPGEHSVRQYAMKALVAKPQLPTRALKLG